MTSTLEIDTLTIDARVAPPLARDGRRGQRVLDTVTASVRDALPRVLGQVLAAGSDEEDIVFIDTLRFEATINAGWPAERIARALAVQLALSLWRAFDRPGAVRFADRAEMLARFFGDLAHGAGFMRDWHRAFDGLRVLPASGVLRTLIEDEPRLARAALARLRPVELDRVLAVLLPADAGRALSAVAGAAGDAATAEPGVVAEAMLEQGCYRLATTRECLALLVALARGDGTEPGLRSLAIARAILLLAADPDTSLPAPVRVERALRRLATESGDARAGLEALAGVSQEALIEASDAMRERVPTSARELPGACGGAWVLLPHALAHLTGPGALAAIAICAGPCAADVWSCAALREALGVEPDAPVEAPARLATPPLSPGDRAHLLSGTRLLPLGAKAARRLVRVSGVMMADYARRLPGFATASFAHLWENLLGAPAIARFEEGTIDVSLAPPPLAVIWSITGADRVRCSLLDGRRLVVGMRR